jgi:hypothetical protein
MNSRFEAKRRKNRLINRLVTIGVIALIIAVFVGYLTFRFDFAGGSHRITPTAVDTDLWGNYMVYFRTSDFTQNSEEAFYYIARGNTALAEQVQEAVLNEDIIMVFYERYIGFKGIRAPRTAPIVRIEVIQRQE